MDIPSGGADTADPTNAAGGMTPDSPPVPHMAILVTCLWVMPVVLYFVFDYWARLRKRVVEFGEHVGVAEGTKSMRNIESITVMCASLEHSLPQLPQAKATAGGLGKVMDLVARHHPTDLYMVHPMIGESDKVNYSKDQADEMPSLRVIIDGKKEDVRVFRHTSWPQGPDGVRVEFLMLSHPLFESRTKEGIYPNPMSRRQVLVFFSLWNQAVGALLARHKPDVYHLPDFHTAVAPWYAEPMHPNLRVLLVLHNAEYQGSISTDMLRGEKVNEMARIWNLPPAMTEKHLLDMGRFNMLKAAVNYVLEKQNGVGVCAVSQFYAQECHNMYSVLWPLPVIDGLDNPMLEEERAKLTEPLLVTKAKAKEEIQKAFELNVDPEARIFVSLGRLVRQKGVDLLADIAPWLLMHYPTAQFILVGPVGDGFGCYAAAKFKKLAEDPQFKGRVFVKCEFMRVPESLKFAADFCLMPSRDEPFGYVDIEFAWRGAVVVGAQAGGLGKVPGFYYMAQNKENPERLRREIRTVISKAIDVPTEHLQQMAEQALQCDFPLKEWQEKLLGLYTQLLKPLHDPNYGRTSSAAAETELQALDTRSESPMRSESSRSVDSSSTARKTFVPYGSVIGETALVPRALRPSITGSKGPRESTAIMSMMDAVVEKLQADDDIWKSNNEFLTQELTEEEIASRIQIKLAQTPDKAIDEILESIGGDVDFEKTTNEIEKWLLQETFGVKRVHWCVSCGYCVAPISVLYTAVMAVEWGVRNGTEVPEFLLRNDTYRKIFGTHGLGPDVLMFLLFSVSGLASAIGPIIWTTLTFHCEPRKILACILVAQLPIIICTMSASGGVGSAMVVVFLQSLLASSGLLFVIFNFMMSIKADMAASAMRMGTLELVRQCVTWGFVGFIFLTGPSSVENEKGSEGIPAMVIIMLLPATLLLLLTTAMPGCLLWFAPGPYRDDRCPGWDLGLFGKQKSFFLLSLSDIVGAIVLFPASIYTKWWIANGWDGYSMGVLCFVIGIVLGGGVLAFAVGLSKFLVHGYSMLVGLALLLAPAPWLRALAFEEASSFIFVGRSYSAITICVLSLFFEGIRASAIWTVKIRILSSRWRLLTYATIFLVAQGIATMISPLLCEFIARQYSATFISTNQQELADAMVVCIAPFALIQYILQVSAMPFIDSEMGSSVQANRGAASCFMKTFRRSPIPTAVLSGLGLGLLVFGLQRIFITREMLYSPVRLCSNVQMPKCEYLKASEQTNGYDFGKNSYGMWTTAKYECHRKMSDTKNGNTFVFTVADDGGSSKCDIYNCADASRLQFMEGMAAPGVQKEGVEVWSQFCDIAGQGIVGVQLFEWTWTDVEKECTEYLAPAGFNMVQVSPPQEHILGDRWSIRYQPVSYKLESRGGSEEEFVRMVKTCKSVGVEVMVDVILNHMASDKILTPDEDWDKHCGAEEDTPTSATTPCQGWAGTLYASRQFLDTTDHELGRYDYEDFHHYPGNIKQNCGAPPWSHNRYTCDIFGLPDLNTESPRVQAKLSAFLRKLHNIGIEMVRIDAAVHIYSDPLSNLLEPIPFKYVVQEIYPQVLELEDKTRHNAMLVGAVTDMAHGHRVSQMLMDSWEGAYAVWKDQSERFGDILELGKTQEDCKYALCSTPVDSNRALLFLDNHDLQRERYKPNGAPDSHPLRGRVPKGHECSAFQDADSCVWKESPLCEWDGFSLFDCAVHYKNGRTYLLGVFYMLAYPYGDAVRLMSSYDFNEWRLGPPGSVANVTKTAAKKIYDEQGTMVGCRGTPEGAPVSPEWDNNTEAEWICEHRWEGTAGFVQLRRVIQAGKTKVTPRYVKDGIVAWSLGAEGFVALHRGFNWGTQTGSNQTFDLAKENVETGLPEGHYCDLRYGQLLEGGFHCANYMVLVGPDGKMIKGSVDSGDGLAIHTRWARLKTPAVAKEAAAAATVELAV
eukprot:TRINITY_DN17710_c0_g3_i1.p1 TRINITY_DN17710_c0_g3~~TRINITY_DN17710_c0_g3_i1.p1  ORF type:complete len:1937 (-),score=531.64 TRINITY_DN17710_c0_g3_i1:89-5899(-)